MTWGEIESTPFRLDGSDTPIAERNHGPSFKVYDPDVDAFILSFFFLFTEVVILFCLTKIPEPGRRERLGLKMANEAAAKNRAKKQEALRKVTENLAR